MPYFSVIVPVYNAEKYIERCLNSVLSQCFIDYEIIIVNDGSTDSSGNIIECFSKKYSRIIVVNQKNQGVSVARNQGVKVSKGRFIVFLDSDDWLLNGFLEYSAYQIKSNSLDGLLLNYRVGSGKKITSVSRKLDKISSPVIDGEKYIVYFLKGLISNAPWDKVFSRDLYFFSEDVFPEGISVGEDAVAMTRVGQRAKRIGVSNESFLIYMQDTGGITKNKVTNKVISDIKKSIDIIVDDCGRVFSHELVQYMVFRQIFFYVLNGDLKSLKNTGLNLMFYKSLSVVKLASFKTIKWKMIFILVSLLEKARCFEFFLYFKKHFKISRK
ncbi:glycosyltransferase family A protein [Marinomonas arenicola]|uniref:glycosyltransferase family 2 protein n=1 Tax=Marinomonas arenicola TaxID=569601 RepID=UPI00311DE0C7